MSETDLPHTLDRLVELAVETVDACEAAGMSVVRRGLRGRRGIDTPSSTGPAVRRAHELQDELGEGPCWDAIWEQETFLVDDLATEERYPKWGPPVVAELGFASILSLRLYNTADTLGSLNLYSYQQKAFDDEACRTGLVLAAHAAVALTSSREQADLSQAASTRLIIGQAEGILMERFGLGSERAFETLRRVSNRDNVKLRDVAQQLVSTRRTPRVRQ